MFCALPKGKGAVFREPGHIPRISGLAALITTGFLTKPVCRGENLGFLSLFLPKVRRYTQGLWQLS